MPTTDDKATSTDAVRTSASAPMSSTSEDMSTHPTIAEHQTKRLPEDLRNEANRIMSDAAGRARSAAEEGKAKASETVSNLAKSTRDAAAQFRGTQAEPLVGYMTSAADSVEKFASTLDQKQVDELIDDFKTMVRKSPAIAIGAAAAVGFAVSRFMKASERAFGDEPARGGSSDYPAAPTSTDA